MAAEIRTLKEGNIEIHPRTVASAVSSSDGTTIDVVIEKAQMDAKTHADTIAGDISTILENINMGTGETIIGECSLKDALGNPSSVPIHKGFAPIDSLAIFKTQYDVEQEGEATAEYISWAALESGDYVLYRGVKPGDIFQEKMV